MDDPQDAFNLTIKKNTVAVVTDGSEVLGLGGAGPMAALPVMEGKCLLFKEFAGVDAFPICLDVNNIDELVIAVKAIAPTFGAIHLEDLSAPRCFEIERRLAETLDIPVMHNDQHGTAIVVLAALINALKITGQTGVCAQGRHQRARRDGCGGGDDAVARDRQCARPDIVRRDGCALSGPGARRRRGGARRGGGDDRADQPARFARDSWHECMVGADVFYWPRRTDRVDAGGYRRHEPRPHRFRDGQPFARDRAGIDRRHPRATIATGKSDLPEPD